MKKLVWMEIQQYPECRPQPFGINCYFDFASVSDLLNALKIFWKEFQEKASESRKKVWLLINDFGVPINSWLFSVCAVRLAMILCAISALNWLLPAGADRRFVVMKIRTVAEWISAFNPLWSETFDLIMLFHSAKLNGMVHIML